MARNMDPPERPPVLSFHQTLYPYMYKTTKRQGWQRGVPEHVATWLAEHGPATVEEAAAGTKVSHKTLLEYFRLGKIPGAVEAGERYNGRGRSAKLWAITREGHVATVGNRAS